MRFAIAAIVMLGTTLPCSAAGVGGSLRLTSDYVYRGLSQTLGDPALQADLHYTAARGVTAGIWLSNVERNRIDGRTVEASAYLSYRFALPREWVGNVSAVRYEYPWNDGRIRYDYTELVGSLGFRNMVFLTVGWTPDASRFSRRGYVTDENAISYEAALSLPMKSWSTNFGAGYYDLDRLIGTGYTYWNAGLSYEWRSWRADITYIGTSDAAKEILYGDVAGNRVTAGVSWQF